MTNINNIFGAVYPTDDLPAMVNQLNLKPEHFIIDVGAGGSPLPVADVIVEYDLVTGIHRDQTTAPVDNRWVVADIQNLPFNDKIFDFSYCSHVLEHVDNPTLACNELMRISNNGYIETPRKITELLHGHPTHQWLIDIVDNKLIFEPRCFIESPLKNFALAHVLNHPHALQSFLKDYRNISCIQFKWEDKFEYEIKPVPEGQTQFNYKDTEQAAWSHFYFALNLLENQAPLFYVQPHIDTAYQLRPDIPCFISLKAASYLAENNKIQAKILLEKILDHHIDDQSIHKNLQKLKDNFIYSVELPLNRKSYTINNQEEVLKKLLHKEQEILDIYNSNSWKITQPFRAIKSIY